ncbi:MAG: NrsF family protein, partial [Pseudomonadales bacterium]
TRPLSPGYWGVRLVAVLVIYAVGIQFILGLRPDLVVQFERPAFAAEAALLVALLLASAVASVLAMYPDAFQKPRFLLLPHAVCFLLSLLIVRQMFMLPDVRMVMPATSEAATECALCIAAVAMIPSALIFILLRKGASVRQYQAGAFALLAAGSIGCLTLRLAEANDSMLHLAAWHYLPTLLFAALGAVVGKQLLKW